MTYLKQSTSVTVQFGPFVDKTDGVTLEAGLAAALDNATTGIRLSKNGAAFADRSDATEPPYDARGFYRVTLDTTDTNTLGTLTMVYEDAATCLPVWREFQVVKANVFDTLFSTDYLEVDVIQLGGGTQSATDLKDFADEGYDPATNKVQGLTAVDSVTAIANGAITAAAIATGAIDADALAADAVAEIADGVWDEATAEHVGAGSTSKALIDIKTKTDFLPSATAGDAGGVFIAGTNAATTITTALTTTFTGNLTGSVASVTGAVGSVTGAVGSVTGNVGGNVAGSVGSVTGAVGSVTGNVGGSVASVAAEVSANVTKINSVAVVGAGTAGDLWRA